MSARGFLSGGYTSRVNSSARRCLTEPGCLVKEVLVASIPLFRLRSRRLWYRLAEEVCFLSLGCYILEGASSNTRAIMQRPYDYLKALYPPGATHCVSSRRGIGKCAEFLVWHIPTAGVTVPQHQHSSR